MKLKRGTYVRERDGATLLYHSELTSWNFPGMALQNWKDCRADGTTRLNEWRQVTDEREIDELRRYLKGHLKPGEYAEINAYDILDIKEESGG